MPTTNPVLNQRARKLIESVSQLIRDHGHRDPHLFKDLCRLQHEVAMLLTLSQSPSLSRQLRRRLNDIVVAVQILLKVMNPSTPDFPEHPEIPDACYVTLERDPERIDNPLSDDDEPVDVLDGATPPTRDD